MSTERKKETLSSRASGVASLSIRHVCMFALLAIISGDNTRLAGRV